MMPNLNPDMIVMALCVGAFTALAAVSDIRSRKIPNRLTAPAFLLGLAYQVGFHGLSGLADAGLAFLLGFGTLFVLWMVGGGGGGDVKLMGALSVWLGFQGTLYVMIASTVFVVVGSASIMVWSLCTYGFRKTKDKYVTAPNPGPGKKPAKETLTPRQKRRVMAYAVPVAVAAWVVVLGQIGNLLPDLLSK